MTINYARRETERIIKELRNQTSRLMEKDRTLLAETARSDLAKVTELVHETLQEDEDLQPIGEQVVPEKPLKLGQTVFIPHLKVKGTIIDHPDSEGNVRVQVGIIKMTLQIKEIQVIANSEKHERKSSVGTIASSKAQTISQELDLRGLTVGDAEYSLEKYLDDVRLAGLERVRLIHGKGTGALRQAVHDYLSNHPQIKSFSLAGYREGGTGVTIAFLKK